MPTAPDPCWWRPFTVCGNASVTYVGLSPDTERESSALGWLDRSEQARLERIRAARRRREFVLCRSALRAILCDRLACDNTQLSFEDSEQGKPSALVRAAPAAIDFSVSHSGGHALIAVVEEGRVGIDVEDRSTPRDIDGAASLTFTPAEQAELAALGDTLKTEFFYRIWTMKEALIKALGVGFGLNPSLFEIPSAMRAGARQCAFRFPHLPGERWQLEDLGNADFAAAIATDPVQS